MGLRDMRCGEGNRWIILVSGEEALHLVGCGIIDAMMLIKLYLVRMNVHYFRAAQKDEASA